MFLEAFHCFLERVLRRILSEMRKLLSHVRPDDVPSMAHILKRFNPDHSSPFYSPDKEIKPEIFHKFEVAEGKEDDHR